MDYEEINRLIPLIASGDKVARERFMDIGAPWVHETTTAIATQIAAGTALDDNMTLGVEVDAYDAAMNDISKGKILNWDVFSETFQRYARTDLEEIQRTRDDKAKNQYVRVRANFYESNQPARRTISIDSISKFSEAFHNNRRELLALLNIPEAETLKYYTRSDWDENGLCMVLSDYAVVFDKRKMYSFLKESSDDKIRELLGKFTDSPQAIEECLVPIRKMRICARQLDRHLQDNTRRY